MEVAIRVAEMGGTRTKMEGGSRPLKSQAVPPIGGRSGPGGSISRGDRRTTRLIRSFRQKVPRQKMEFYRNFARRERESSKGRSS